MVVLPWSRGVRCRRRTSRGRGDPSSTSPRLGLDGRWSAALMACLPCRRRWGALPAREAVGEEVLVVGPAERGSCQVAAPAARVLVAGDLLLVPVPPGAASLVATLQGAGVLERFSAAEGGVAALGLSSAHGHPPFPVWAGDGRRRGRRRWARPAPAIRGRSQAGGSVRRAGAARRPCPGRTPWPAPRTARASGRSPPSRGLAGGRRGSPASASRSGHRPARGWPPAPPGVLAPWSTRGSARSARGLPGRRARGPAGARTAWYWPSTRHPRSPAPR